MTKITNATFAQAVKDFTTPKIKFKDLAKTLGMSVQNLRYHAYIRPALYPNEESVFTTETLDLILNSVDASKKIL